MEKQYSSISLNCLAVVLIDMQDYFIDTKEKVNLIQNQIPVLSFCKDKNIPLIVVEYGGIGKTVEILRNEIDKISKELVFTIRKYDDNAFSEKDFEDLLKKHNIKTLLIMGINACACVYETANTAIKKGYNIITSDSLMTGYCSTQCAHKHAWYLTNGVHLKDPLSVLD